MKSDKNFKRIFLLLAALLVAVLAVDTFVEQRQGGSYAREHVYYSWWFVGLWALLAVLSVLVLVRKRLWRRLPVFMLHVSPLQEPHNYLLNLLNNYLLHPCQKLKKDMSLQFHYINQYILHMLHY